MMFVTPAPDMGPIRGLGSGLLAGRDALHGRQMDVERNALANRNAATQEGYLQRLLQSDKREADALAHKEREGLIAEYREAKRRGDRATIRAVAEKLERSGIDVTDIAGPPNEVAPPNLELSGVDTSLEGALIEDTPGALDEVDSLAGGSVMPPSTALPTGQRLVDKSTGQSLGEVGEADTDLAAGNVGQVFLPLIQNARSPQHAQAGVAAAKAAQQLAPIFGEAKAIEFGKEIYEKETLGIDKVTAGRGIGGVAGTPGTISGLNKTDFGQIDQGDTFAAGRADAAQSKVLGGAKGYSALRDFSTALEMLDSSEGLSQRQAGALLLRAMSGLTVNKGELDRLMGGAGKVEQIENWARGLADGTLSEQYKAELRTTIRTLSEGIATQIQDAGEAARNGILAAGQYPDPVERAGRAAYAYRSVTGSWGPYEQDAKAWDKQRPNIRAKPQGTGKRPDAKPGGNQSRVERLRKLAGG